MHDILSNAYKICSLKFQTCRGRTTSKPSAGFQLFICFVNIYELHYIHTRRRHVAVLNRKVSNADKQNNNAEVDKEIPTKL